MSRIFLAGATGVVGRHLLPRLVAAGHEVTALTRRTADAEGLRSQGARAVVGDVFDADGLRSVVAAAAPEIVMHQLTDLTDLDFAANGRIRRVGTRNLVDAALAAGARRMVVQSIAWVYEPGDRPAGEETPLDLAAESESRRGMVDAVATMERIAGELPEWVVLRYGALYGPGTWFAPGGLRSTQLHEGSLVADADVSSFLHVEDAAASAVEALDWPTGVVNVVDDVPAPASEWLPVFARAVGAPAPEVVRKERTGWARGADNTHARKNLGWTPLHSSWREGFAQTAAGPGGA
ncbi:NAD-dependent epimerase/dehydratase family protein [Kribbella sp. CA-253562]|uniref:NAD-dependent epimerase/dehydratase family protein n=1 Tax=Kribbella sp. CA-253562 TaxID=3239942 RepID=UPI003D8B8ACA